LQNRKIAAQFCRHSFAIAGAANAAAAANIRKNRFVVIARCAPVEVGF